MKKLSFKFKVTLFFVLITLSCYSQKSKPPIFISKVYNDMFATMDNGQTIKPKVFVTSDSLEVVSYYPKENEILIGKKFIKLIRNFKNDSCNAIAHVLGHELAHIILQQNDFIKNVGSGYASKEFNSKLNKIQRTLKDSVFERQADEYSTLYAHIAGYKTSQLGEQLLDSIYINYNLKDSELFRYPSLVDRKKIVRLTSEKMKVLCLLYEHAFYSLVHKDYDLSIAMYSAIIQEKFTSVEIYNNLALANTLKALESLSSEEYNNEYPFEFEFDTNLKTLERSLDDDSEEYLLEAIRLFDIAIFKNKLYYKTYLNKAITEVLLKRFEDASITLNSLTKSNDKFLLEKKEILEIIIERMKGSTEQALLKMKVLASNNPIADKNIYKWTGIKNDKLFKSKDEFLSSFTNFCNLNSNSSEAKVAGDKILSKLIDKNKFRLKYIEDNSCKLYNWQYIIGENKPSIRITEAKNNFISSLKLELNDIGSLKTFITLNRKIVIFEDIIIIIKDNIVEKIIKLK